MLVTPSNDQNYTHRSSAGVLLKNNVLKRFENLPPDTVSYVKTEIVKGLTDSAPMIRNISGNVITSLVTRVSIGGWPEILPQLMNMAEGNDKGSAEGAMSTLDKICEDSAKELDQDYNGERPLNYMIPKFLQFTRSDSAKIRSLSVACINQFVVLKSQSLLAHLDAFLNALFTLAGTDENPETRRNICAAFVSIMGVRPDKLAPHLEGVISFTLHCIKDSDESVAKEGCEFILQLAESEDMDNSLISAQMNRIVPTILSTMVYSEMDQMVLQSLNEDDEDIEDKPEDIRPNIVKAKDAHHSSKKEKLGADDSDEDDEFDDDDASAEDSLSEWNLRKCSAAALDVFATKCPDLVLEYSMPHLREGIVSQDWSVREASILAFGAISQGCLDLVGPNLPELIPFLVRTLRDGEPAVRQITCWTLTRYSSWIAYHSAGGANHETYLQPVLEGILACCLDKNKKVQEAACGALATLTEEAGEELASYLEVIFTQLALCFQKFRAKNMSNLYDSVQALLTSVGSAIEDPKLIQILLPPLMDKWNKTSDDDRDVWPLFECMSVVASSFGGLFGPYAGDVYARAVQVISDNLIMDQNCQNDITLEAPDKEFVIVALDMIDGLVQGLKSDMSTIIAQSQTPLAELLLACFEDPIMDVRQSAFALLGDLGLFNNVDQLKPYMDNIMGACLSQMDMAFGPGVCNNAIWSAGELVLRLGPAVQPYAANLSSTLVQLLDSGDTLVSTVSENAAIALGRLGQCVPEMLAEHISVFTDKWCYYIKDIPETDEKETAYIGMCSIIEANPEGLANESLLLPVIDTLASYAEPSPQLSDEIRKVLSGYKSLVPEWDAFLTKLPSDSDAWRSIRENYGL